MKITIEPTAHITTVDGQQCRAWKGVTEKGTACVVFVATVAVPQNTPAEIAGAAEFEAELRELFPNVAIVSPTIVEIDRRA